MPETQADYASLVTDLERLLKLRSICVGMKLFRAIEDMESVPGIRRPQAVHTTDQIVAQATRLGWTVGITGDDLVGEQCRRLVCVGCRFSASPGSDASGAASAI